MRSNQDASKAAGQSGMALMAVMIMLVIMTVIGMGMYQLVANTIAVSGGYAKKATTRTIAIAEASLLMELVTDSFTGTGSVPVGLTMLDSNYLFDIMGSPGNNISTDDVDNSPDFSMTLAGTGIVATGDVDYLQSVPIAGGSLEFASAYDGVGSGQVLGSAFLVEHMVHVKAVDASGAKTEIRFMTEN